MTRTMISREATSDSLARGVRWNCMTDECGLFLHKPDIASWEIIVVVGFEEPRFDVTAVIGRCGNNG